MSFCCVAVTVDSITEREDVKKKLAICDNLFLKKLKDRAAFSARLFRKKNNYLYLPFSSGTRFNNKE